MFPNSRICYLKDIINHATIKLLCKFKEKEFDNDEEENFNSNYCNSNLKYNN